MSDDGHATSNQTSSKAVPVFHSGGDKNFQTFIETIDDLVFIADKEGQIIYANPASSQKLGYPPEDLPGMALLDLHPRWARKEAKQILGEMFAGLRDSCPLPLKSEDGRLVPVETRVWFGQWNGQDCIFGLCKDLSSEQELLQKFEKMFQVNPTPMAISSMQTRQFVEVNQAFLDLLGYQAEQVVGKTSEELNLTPQKEDHSRAAQMLEEYGALKNLEMKVKAKDGTLSTGMFSGSIFESQGKKFMLTVMVDITTQKHLENEQEKTILELRSALDQIQTLKGILPICASCKKIRDDHGYWEQVEQYIARHTSAEFSHGICPDCKEQLYSDFDTNP